MEPVLQEPGPQEPGLPADRRPSITRLAAALPETVGDGLGLALCLLFARHLRFDTADPFWADRDRLVMDPSLEGLGETLAELTGLPPRGFYGQANALGAAVGSALAERMLAGRFGRSLVDHRCWVAGTGACLATGAAQEAAWLAGTWRLGRLTGLFSVPTEDAPGLAGFSAAGWSVRRVRADDAAEVASCLSAAMRSQKPTLIACVRPRGGPPLGGAGSRHCDAAEDSLAAWAGTGRRNAGVRRAWLKRLARHGSRTDFEGALAGRLASGWHNAFFVPGPLLPPGEKTVSTSWTLRRAMIRLAAAMPELASLPGEPSWKHLGIAGEFCHAREAAGQLSHGIGAAMAGVAMHGGLVPLSTHTLADTEAALPGLREAAASGLRLIKVLVEAGRPCPAGGKRASLRAMRNLLVFRPADASEALECAELALRHTSGPSVLLISDLPVPALAERPSRTRCVKGGYVLAEAAAPRAATLIASGPELHVALQARAILAAARTPVAVVSLPCWNFFARQEAAWQEAVLGDAPRIGIEAGGGFGWDRWLGANGLFIGSDRMEDQAFSGKPAGFCPQRVAEIVLRHLGVVTTV